MRIGVNTLFLVPGDVGGTEVYLKENLKEMVPGNPQDSFVLFTSMDNDESLKKDLGQFENVEFIRLPFRAAVRPIRIIVEQIILPLKVRKENIGVLWSPGYTAPMWCPCPQVVTIHDLQYKTHPEDLSYLERLTLDFLVKNSCRRCDFIIAVSKFSKNEITRFKFASKDKVSVIYEGVDRAFGEPVKGDISELVDIPIKTPYILCVAHTYPHKRVHLLIQAFGNLMREIPHHLILVGKPRRGENEVKKSLKGLPDSIRVHRIENLEYSDLKVIYQKADLFVLPSEYEGFGLPVLEALLAGVPVVTTNNASLPEVGGECVQLTQNNTPGNLAETIKETLNLSMEERKKLIVEGKSWARSFSWEKSADETIELLTSLMS